MKGEIEMTNLETLIKMLEESGIEKDVVAFRNINDGREFSVSRYAELIIREAKEANITVDEALDNETDFEPVEAE